MKNGEKKFFWKIFEFVPKLPKFWQVVDPKKKKKVNFFFQTWHIIYFWKGNLISNTMVKILSL